MAGGSPARPGVASRFRGGRVRLQLAGHVACSSSGLFLCGCVSVLPGIVMLFVFVFGSRGYKSILNGRIDALQGGGADPEN